MLRDGAGSSQIRGTCIVTVAPRRKGDVKGGHLKLKLPVAVVEESIEWAEMFLVSLMRSSL